MSHRVRSHWTLGLTSLVILAGCGETPETAYHDSELGIHFDYPEGWRRLKPSELPPGKESLVTIEDSTGLASVSLVEFDLQAVIGTLDMQLLLQMARDEDVSEGLALFVQLNTTFDEVFERRYNRYRLLDRNWARPLPGAKALTSELVFQGQLPGEPMKWRMAAIILIVGQEEKGFIMAYSAPLSLLDDFRPAFQFVEDSWRTIS
jgi:hypothetical protein